MTTIMPEFKPLGCDKCLEGGGLDFSFSMAFQPIVNVLEKQVFGYEALVRGLNNEPAYTVLDLLNDTNRYSFDQTIRVKAIQMAKQLNLQGMLSINFFPNAVYRPETCIRATLEAAAMMDFPTENLMFEVTEVEKVNDNNHLRSIFEEYKKHNFTTAIDDFGSGYAGLNLLADLQPDIIKLDMALIRNISTDKVRQSIVRSIIMTCRDLDIKVIAEGVETIEEFEFIRDQGVALFQGYYFARPEFEALPKVDPTLYN